MVPTQILLHRWGPRTKISALFRRRTEPEFSFVCGAGYIKIGTMGKREGGGGGGGGVNYSPCLSASDIFESPFQSSLIIYPKNQSTTPESLEVLSY